jgi:hypothetical protein
VLHPCSCCVALELRAGAAAAAGVGPQQGQQQQQGSMEDGGAVRVRGRVDGVSEAVPARVCHTCQPTCSRRHTTALARWRRPNIRRSTATERRHTEPRHTVRCTVRVGRGASKGLLLSRRGRS